MQVHNPPVSLREMCDQHVNSPAVIGFLEQNYNNRSVANKIPLDAELALMQTEQTNPVPSP